MIILCSSLRCWRVQQLLHCRGIHITEVYQNGSRIQARWGKSSLSAHRSCNYTLVTKEVGILNHDGLQCAILQRADLLGIRIEPYCDNVALSLILLNGLGRTVSRHIIIGINSNEVGLAEIASFTCERAVGVSLLL